jgi:putative Holliday junction resolvase
MTVLGVDYGTKRIGLASGDTALAMAFPLRSADAGASLADGVRAVLAAAAEEGAGRIVVGVPRRMTGSVGAAPGDTEARALAFIAALRAATALPVDEEDERLSSMYADSVMRSAGGKRRDFDRDAGAAAAILDTYLARMANQ